MAAETIPIRADETFDCAAVENFLRRHDECPPGDLEVEQFPGGNSNLTYLLRIGNKEWVMRRPPLGPLLETAHDVRREFTVLRALAETEVPSPTPVAFCEDRSLIGSPFYIMERLHGFVLHKGELPPEIEPIEKRREIGFGMVEALAELHTVDYELCGLATFGKPEGFAERQVRRWRKQWLGAKTREVESIDQVHEWLSANLPADAPRSLVHGDASTHNAMFDRRNPRRVVALLDWEMSTLGDPLCDLGYFIALWPQEGDSEIRRRTTNPELRHPAMPSRAELIAHYEKLTGISTKNMRFYQTLALYKLAVILEGIYSRYVKGQTRDARFEELRDRMVWTADAAREEAFSNT
jgi:aminoglycoside phosphotransferase (APT) family kinase protein